MICSNLSQVHGKGVNFSLLNTSITYKDFLDQAIKEFEHGLDFIIMHSVHILELDASLDEPNAISLSVSLNFLCSISILSDSSKSQLAVSIIAHRLWSLARAVLKPVLFAGSN